MPTTTTRLFTLGIAGFGLTAALAGCAMEPGVIGGGSDDGSSDGPTSVDPSADTSAEYTDGTYTAEGDYVSPAGPSRVTVELTIADDIVTAVTVTPLATDPTSKGFQTQFSDGISTAIVGADIDSLAVSRVSGSSLTSGGFNDALEQIKAEALV